MVRSEITVLLNEKPVTIWKTLTNIKDYPSWRKDIKEVRILSENQFQEIDRNGFITTFTTTLLENNTRWEFDIDNSNISGHWIGIIKDINGKTGLTLIEEIQSKKKIPVFLQKLYISHQQKLFMQNIKNSYKKN